MPTGCAPDEGRGPDAVDPRDAGEELVQAVGAGRDAIGGEWQGSWSRNVTACASDSERFRGYFEQGMSGDPEGFEVAVQRAWDGHGAPVVRTDRPDGSTELLLEREDGLSLLLTVTEVKTSIIAASACFPGEIGPDPLELLPQSEPRVVQR